MPTTANSAAVAGLSLVAGAVTLSTCLSPSWCLW
jgi:hypothetical protein